ncbi:hypothetical protein EO93_02345 [Methanosarcina sp. 1.H.A.2.2]|nr:hypothetical protein EO93_02345 [Methanosarcina sp. 1.H.A.2.2]
MNKKINKRISVFPKEIVNIFIIIQLGENKINNFFMSLLVIDVFLYILSIINHMYLSSED